MEYEDRFRSIFHGVVDIISLIDINYNLLMVNTAYEHLLKKSEKECIGEKCYKVIRDREVPCEDCPILKKDFDNRCEDNLTILINKENVSISRHPVYNQKGEITGIFEIGKIITKELRMENELQHHGRLKIMGELVASIVHEIKNPLVGIGLMSVSIMERLQKKKQKDELYTDIKSIFLEVKRLEKLLQHLMDFSKPASFITIREDIHHPIERSLKLIHNKFRTKGIKIKKIFSSEIPKIKIDPAKMQQIFLNLFLNSIEAMPDEGQITIKTDIFHEEIESRKKAWVRITIQDNGIGIKEEDLPYIFDPFFSRSSQRTGLGLSIVLRLIESHKGEIIIQSKEGKGTTVKIYFPTD